MSWKEKVIFGVRKEVEHVFWKNMEENGADSEFIEWLKGKIVSVASEKVEENVMFNLNWVRWDTSEEGSDAWIIFKSLEALDDEEDVVSPWGALTLTEGNSVNEYGSICDFPVEVDLDIVIV